ncbi:MAG: hypothetical protein QOJ59_4280 [Thermomicrobiales bacterium]|jgi:hypothetical protein|nr:hypothetical protein [Thermomicrobiales bacterium]
MVNDALDRIRDVLGHADTNDWIAAIIVGVIVQILVLLVMRVFGFFLRMASWLLASAISIVVALYVLDRRGIPRSIGGRQIDSLIDDARRFIGV